MDVREVAKTLIDLVGSKSNVKANATCMTRLRVKVKESPDLNKLKKVEGIINVVEADTLQIVLGPGTVNSVGQEFSKLSGISLGFSDVKELADENKKINRLDKV